MTYRQDVAHGRDVVARWCNLAEQRLEYLTELFETGRWRRFHSERAFLENIQEAKAAVETWRDLLSREASREEFVLDFFAPSRARTPLPREAQPRRIGAFSLQPASFPDEAPRPVATMAPIDAPPIEPDQVAAATPEPALDSASELTLDIIAAVQQRYPLLRNAL
ncbi:TIGR03809 family protein [Bradyrhizobium sp. S69]|uniref:TIGR03809 family protein n=1 Tax=Bradyrhizobium sp. S69 TaxID=1641856 RepID=UPI00131D0156|nr:TIGR03809 family protein [Bradyrhizobium sp. S69]